MLLGGGCVACGCQTLREWRQQEEEEEEKKRALNCRSEKKASDCVYWDWKDAALWCAPINCAHWSGAAWALLTPPCMSRRRSASSSAPSPETRARWALCSPVLSLAGRHRWGGGGGGNQACDGFVARSTKHQIWYNGLWSRKLQTMMIMNRYSILVCGPESYKPWWSWTDMV